MLNCKAALVHYSKKERKTEMPKLILASKSPRRISLLTDLGIDIKAIAADIDESKIKAETPAKTTTLLAEKKAEHIALEKDRLEIEDGDIIVAADTLVEIDGRALGKPKNEEDAFLMLKGLSGRDHFVHSGVCIIAQGKGKISFCETTRVKFVPVSDREIRRYIATGEPMDKAGAYGIQGRGGLFVSSIEGDYFNVMGLPLCRLSHETESNFGISLFDFIDN